MNTLALGGESAQEMLDTGASLIEQFLTHPYPIVGACTGSAYAMAAFLLLASDLRIGVQGDWKIGMNEVAIGLTLPPFACVGKTWSNPCGHVSGNHCDHAGYKR